MRSAAWFWLAATLASATLLPAQPQGERTNVIFLSVDDLGYGDLSSYGNGYHQTPNLDKLAAEGVRFTNAYAPAPVSGASRAAILKAQWPARLGLTHDLPPVDRPYAKVLQPMEPRGVPSSAASVGRRFRGAGYLTAFFGSWGLGDGVKAPKDQGFQLGLGVHKGTEHRGMFLPLPEMRLMGPRGMYLSDVFAQLGDDFIRFAEQRPFFLYVSFYAVSPPIQGKPDIVRRVSQRKDPSGRNFAEYAAMIEGVDEAVGKIMASLEAAGMTDRTAIFFFSDNGGMEGRAFQGGLRKGRGWLYEGGIRVPLIVRWPREIEGGSVVEAPVSLLDAVRTALDAASATDVGEGAIDGRNLLPVIAGEGEETPLFFHFPHYSEEGSAPVGAVREGDLKLVEWYEDGSLELYNLAEDPGESSNLADLLPEKAKELSERLAAWRKEVGAREAEPNPQYDPNRVQVKETLPY
jgi:arylsulfatase A-like enzyme